VSLGAAQEYGRPKISASVRQLLVIHDRTLPHTTAEDACSTAIDL
jgi:hypothetical protein